jgi:hypothetical protein
LIYLQEILNKINLNILIEFLKIISEILKICKAKVILKLIKNILILNRVEIDQTDNNFGTLILRINKLK